MYAHWLGGKDSFAADRTAADAVLERFPEVAEVARANRAFLARAIRHVARQRVTQFIDFGAGLPASPNVHEIARQEQPDARVVSSTVTRSSCSTRGRCWPPISALPSWREMSATRPMHWPIRR